MANLLLTVFPVKKFFQVLKPNKEIIDSVIFRLHYKLTTGIFIACCLVTSAPQFFGNPIQCVGNTQTSISSDLINTFCWVISTFTLPGRQGKEVLHPGVVASAQGEQVRYHSYYQWVPFMLLLKGALFAVPHIIWAAVERSKISSYCTFFPSAIDKPEVESDHARKAADHFLSEDKTSNLYAVMYLFAHFLNLVNAVGSIFLIDRALGNVFLTYGIDYFRFLSAESADRADPAVVIFPTMTKCTYRRYGPSAEVQVHDFLCALSLNVINEKIYVCLWLWLVILSLLTTVELLFELILLLVPAMRIWTARFYFPRKMLTCTKMTIRELQYGDYVLLRAVNKNTCTQTFARLVSNLHSRICERVEIDECRTYVTLDPPQEAQ